MQPAHLVSSLLERRHRRPKYTAKTGPAYYVDTVKVIRVNILDIERDGLA